jgi:hypothetical protein
MRPTEQELAWLREIAERVTGRPVLLKYSPVGAVLVIRGIDVEPFIETQRIQLRDEEWLTRRLLRYTPELGAISALN